MSNEFKCLDFKKRDCTAHYVNVKNYCSSCFEHYCVANFDPANPTKQQLEGLGIYDNCKFCGGSLEYKQGAYVGKYKSTCKSCKKDKSNYYRKKWHEDRRNKCTELKS